MLLCPHAGDVLLICRPTSCGKAAYAPLEAPVEVDLGVQGPAA